MTLGDLQLTFLVPLFDFIDRLVHVIALPGKDIVELIQACRRIRNIRDLFGKRFDLFGYRVNICSQGSYPLFKGNDTISGLAMFFVHPFEAFDELFKFHVFLQQITLIAYLPNR
jgi:hypothetical protein